VVAFAKLFLKLFGAFLLCLFLLKAWFHFSISRVFSQWFGGGIFVVFDTTWSYNGVF
jgi:hypothetical protein